MDKRLSYPNWDNVAGAVNHREARVHQHLPQKFHTPLMFPSECPALLTLQDLYGLLRPSQQHGGQGSGEDEACSIGAHCVHQGAGAGDVAAHTAKCLAWKQNPRQVREAHMKPVRVLWEVSPNWWVLCIPSVPEMMSILCMTLSLWPMPPPLGPYKPTAWTSSTKVMAPNLWAKSHISSSGHTAPEGSRVVDSWLFKPTYFLKKKNLFKYCTFTFICAYHPSNALFQRQQSLEWKGWIFPAAPWGGWHHCGGR